MALLIPDPPRSGKHTHLCLAAPETDDTKVF